jgi:SAM-dependent methyltransferase
MGLIPQHRGSDAQYAQYFAAMDAAMQQKVALTTAHLPTRGRIADMGCGSGKGTYDLGCLHPQLEVVGVDLNPISVASARGAYQRANVSFIEGDIGTPVFPDASLDGILDSSVLHHVTSYNGFSRDRLEGCLDHQVRALAAGGVLIIRDFIIPDGPQEVVLELPQDDGSNGSGDIAQLSTAELFTVFARDFRSSQNRTSTVPYRELGDDGRWRRFRVNLRAAQEFILRKDYRDAWSLELQEEYTYWTLAEGMSALEARGLRVVVASAIRNPWIIANRYRGRIRLRTPANESLPFPPTNALLVAERIPAGGSQRIRERDSTTLHGSGFLSLASYRDRDTGRTYDLVSRPGRTLDLLPWFREDDRILVLAKQGFPRPVVCAAAHHPDLLGSHWSGHITEPIAAIIDDGEDDLHAIPGVLAQRAGIPAGGQMTIGAPWCYLPSPGGIDERVTAYPVEITRVAPVVVAYGPQQQDTLIRALDARQVLRCAHVGGLFDARLELGCYRLLTRLGLPWGPWIGATVAASPQEAPRVVLPGWDCPRQAPFQRADASMDFLERRLGTFVDCPPGSGHGGYQREYVLPTGFSRTTALCLPYRLSGATWYIAYEPRCLPSLQLATGNANTPCLPGWRLPLQVRNLDDAEAFMRERLRTDHGLSCETMTALGGAYLPTPGVTPEIAIPYACEVLEIELPARDTRCRWLPLELALRQADLLLDAHLLIALHRFCHAVGQRVDADAGGQEGLDRNLV